MSYDNNLNFDEDKQIGDYILHDEIGSGGFAKVVKGIHIPTGEKVAIKIMDKIQLFTDPLNLRRVKTEISLLKIVRHKNIIKLYEVIETPQKIYLIMEYCEGGELFDYIVKKQSLTERQSCIFFHEIIDALEYLHLLNIVHRDIIPENLLIDKINKKISLKLIDFGISNTYNMENLLITPCGTASYAPPEMHKGERYYGLLTDIWSAGVVLYAMVFGYLPFCDDDEDTNINNIIDGNYEIPSSASPELYDLLLHLLDINPITRYDIDQIKMHPWYNMVSSENNRPGLIIGYHKIPVDERIVNICNSYGYDANKVRESVINNNYDNNSSIYYIVLNKMKKMGIESISDLNSCEYLNYVRDPDNIFFKKKNSIKKINNTNENEEFISNKNNTNTNTNTNTNSNSYSTSNNKNQKYNNIEPSSNIQFSINCSLLEKKKGRFNKFKFRQRNSLNYKEKIKNNIQIKNNNNNINLNEKRRKKNNSSGKNKKILVNSKKVEEKIRKKDQISINVNSTSIERRKKESNNQLKDINNLFFQSNKTFSIISKFKIGENKSDNNYNDKLKKNESFNKKLTDDIKEKILKMRNPKIKDKKPKVKEAHLKLQLKIKKNYKNKQNNQKIGKKVSIFNRDKIKHTIVHNRNASATPNRHNKNKNDNKININYIKNNININYFFIQKLREHSSSPAQKHIENNSSIIKYQKMSKNQQNQQNKLNYSKNDYNYKNNITITSKNNNTIDNLETIIPDSCPINKSFKKINYQKNQKKIIPKLSGCKNNLKKFLNNIDTEIISKSARNRNSSLTSRRNPKEAKSINFLSFLNKKNISSAKKRINNQSILILKNSNLNSFNKKKNAFHTIFNENNQIKKEYYNKSQEKGNRYQNHKNMNNSVKNNKIKKIRYCNEIKDDSSCISKKNKLSNCISPVHKKNKNNYSILNKKIIKKPKNISISLALNTTRVVNHKKCSSMKYVESNSDSFNYDINFTQKVNRSYREREVKKEKEKFKNKNIHLLSLKKSCNKRKIINLSFKSKYNKEKENNNINTKSNYLFKKNIFLPKRYNGPVDFRNIVIGSTGLDICDKIESIIKKKKNINLHRVNPYKIICWKPEETIDINIHLIAGNLISNNINKCSKIIDIDTNELEIKYNNTYTGFYKNGEINKDKFSIKYNQKIKNNIFYINILSQKEKKNKNQSLFKSINKLIYNNFNFCKKYYYGINKNI